MNVEQNKRSITIRDVAKKSGVSVSTVSRVLNGKVDVAKATKNHVLKIIDDLGYSTNLAARSMRSSKKNLIGLIMPDIAYPYAIEVMKGVNQAIAESEFDLLVYTSGDVRKRGHITSEQKYITLLAKSISDGIIVVAPVTSEYNIDKPIVSIDPVTSDPSYPSVHATNYEGSMEAVEYLIGLGHQRIGFIGGRVELESANQRLSGYRNALEEAGIPVDEQLIVSGDYTTKTGIEGGQKLLLLEDRPTAIFASNDQMAMGVYQIAEEMELHIPGDFSLVGFDNIPESKYLGLTTVDQFISEMGYAATQMLIRIINEIPEENQTLKIKTQLVVRNSCRPYVGKN
ncbi:MAG TPA: LacI family DNA-binding transcriptional regulator [Anaerolineaceae bacterium]|nr:LacI family DNA-binding transcriptional regulator [Anaerolineaceae bacterium]